MLSIDDRDLLLAVEYLKRGDLVAFPTETVYGLGGDAENDLAVAAIFAAKGRPSFNPLILHLAQASLAERYVSLDARAEAGIARFWPGPLTLVLPRRQNSPASLLASAGLDSIALRMPADPRALALLSAFGHAVAAPSANRSGRVSPTTAEHVASEFAGAAQPSLILDGGPCAIGLESTVLDLTSDRPRLLRPGAVLAEELREVLPDLEMGQAASGEAPVAPGMLASHYAPSLPLRLGIGGLRDDEALLAFGPSPGRPGSLNLSESGDLSEAAAHLFSYLRELDDPARWRGIAVMPIPEAGLGLAINDRLRRAAAPRPKN